MTTILTPTLQNANMLQAAESRETNHEGLLRTDTTMETELNTQREKLAMSFGSWPVFRQKPHHGWDGVFFPLYALEITLQIK